MENTVYSHNGIPLRKKKKGKWLLIYLTTWMNVRNIMLTLPLSSLRWFLKMVCYSLDPEYPAKWCKSRGSNLHVHFKNTHDGSGHQGLRICEKPTSIWRMSLCRSSVSFHCYNGRVGRCARAKQWGWIQGRWQKKSAEFLLHMLKMVTVMLNLRVSM